MLAVGVVAAAFFPRARAHALGARAV
jgi:hypothetical protein